MHTLLIPLAGPMQAWGSRSRFDDRDTHQEPTKSGVLGLVCAALGRDRAESITDLEALLFGVRVEKPGRVRTDYQTAQNVARAGGGSNLATVTSQRHYLADARFLAGLAGENLALLVQIEAALHNPRWCLSLGRKAYALSLPPYLPQGSIRQEVGLETALRQEPWSPMYRNERPPERLRLALEDGTGEAAFADQPLDYAERRFGLRHVHFYSEDEPPPRIPFSEGKE
ncbi:MAG: type I-E CRISPR-associated protein Cas5/CasD [Janthinobacterium lividum]